MLQQQVVALGDGARPGILDRDHAQVGLPTLYRGEHLAQGPVRARGGVLAAGATQGLLAEGAQLPLEGDTQGHSATSDRGQWADARACPRRKAVPRTRPILGAGGPPCQRKPPAPVGGRGSLIGIPTCAHDLCPRLSTT